jgi:hypothetical protein
MTKETDSYSYEVTLRAVGQALEALGVESFELVLDGDNFVVYGGSESTLTKQKPALARRFRFLGRNRNKVVKQRRFYISGMRLRRSDVKRLDDQSKKFRISAEGSPDTDRLSHALRMIGAHVDKTGIVLLGIQRDKGLFTVWHKARNGDRLNEIFTQANLYDLWVHLYKQRKALKLRPTGTSR